MTATGDSPLRILVLATTFPARAGDGTPEFVLTLSGAFAASGAQVTAVVPRVPGGASNEVLDHGAIMPNLRAHPWRVLEVPPLVLAFLVAALRQVRRERPDVVHAHWVVPGGFIARVLLALTRVPYVVTAHGADAYMLRTRTALRLKRAVLRGAAATVPVSAAIGTELAKLGPVSPPVPMGVDIARIAGEVGPRKPERGRVLFVGRLVEKKGVDVLLRAAARVPAAFVAIVGDGPSRRALEALAAELRITDRVEFLGARPRQGVMDEMARAALVAVPSQVGAGGDQDGVPVVLGEAMAAGVPIIASDLGGVGEYVSDGDNARVVKSGSVDELAEAIAELIEHPDDADKLASRASDRLAGTLGLAHIADRYLSVLRSAAAG